LVETTQRKSQSIAVDFEVNLLCWMDDRRRSAYGKVEALGWGSHHENQY